MAYIGNPEPKAKVGRQYPTGQGKTMASHLRLVLLYNHANPDESFLTMLTDEEIEQAEEENSQFSSELYDLAQSRKVDILSICYYA